MVLVFVIGAAIPGTGSAETLKPLHPGPNNDITDVDGILVGHFNDLTEPAGTGTTVLLLPDKAVGGVDVRGGGPGTIETDVLDARRAADKLDAVFLSGGSAFGLAARGGVVRCVEESGKGFQLAGSPDAKIPMVAGAIIFDLGRGYAAPRPTADFGYQACKAARKGPIAQGTVGAGTGANSGGVKGGFGSASTDLGNGIIVGAVAVVNSVGATFRSDNCELFTAYLELSDEWGNYKPDCTAPAAAAAPAQGPAEAPSAPKTPGKNLPQVPGLDAPLPADPVPAATATQQPAGSQPNEDEPEGDLKLDPQNTTIGVVAVNVKLSKAQVNMMATAAHDGMARAIRPAHTLLDGDTLFSLSTERLELECLAREVGADPDELLADIYSVAADTFSRATNHAILRATTLGGSESYCDQMPNACGGALPTQSFTASTGACVAGASTGFLPATGGRLLVLLLGSALLVIGLRVVTRMRRPRVEAV